MSVSEGAPVLEPGGKPLDWKAVARLHPCIVKRLRMAVCWSGYSTNLQEGEGRRKIISRKKLGNNLSWHKLQSISLTCTSTTPFELSDDRIFSGLVFWPSKVSITCDMAYYKGSNHIADWQPLETYFHTRLVM